MKKKFKCMFYKLSETEYLLKLLSRCCGRMMTNNKQGNRDSGSVIPLEGASELALATEWELTKRVGTNKHVGKVPLGHVGK